MKTTYVSTFALSAASRRSVLDMQSKLSTLQQEVVTGRVADAGLELGARAGQAVGLRREHASLQAIVDSNAIVSSRLDATQSALDSIDTAGQDFLDVLINAKSNASDARTTQARAQEGLASLIGGLNTTHSGEFIFGGINSGETPIAGYEDGAPAKQAVADAFQARFGFAQDDPAAASISAADMQDFLDNDFAALFDDTQWSANWSSASSETIRGRISSNTIVETGASANDASIRKLAMAFTMVSDLGIGSLSEEAYKSIVDTASTLAGSGITGVTQLRAHLGATQRSVSDADERLSSQMDVVAQHLSSLESVDPYEASTRVDTLLTQIETSYALTARIQQLSLLNYL